MQNRKTTIESNLKTFARSESDCTLSLGLSSLIKNISNTRQSNLLLHFFKMLKLLLRSLGAEECLTRKCWPMDELAPFFLHALFHSFTIFKHSFIVLNIFLHLTHNYIC